MRTSLVSKYLIVISCMLLLLTMLACGKNNTVPQSYMKYKVDGIDQEFDTWYVTIMGQFPNSNPPIYYCSIAGGRYNNHGIDMTFYNNNDNTTKQYTESVFERTGLPTGILGRYKDKNDNLYISWQTGWTYYSVKIDVTDIASAYIKGTFSGTMRMVSGTKKVSITEGKFLALIKK